MIMIPLRSPICTFSYHASITLLQPLSTLQIYSGMHITLWYASSSDMSDSDLSGLSFPLGEQCLGTVSSSKEIVIQSSSKQEFF